MVPSTNPLFSLSCPPVSKPVAFEKYTRSQAEEGGDRNSSASLVLIQNGGNIGFAAETT